jgi:tetratricopeptide (TPR) repeat protein
MGLRVVFGCGLTRSAVAAAILAALGGTCAVLVRPERDPERLWQSVQADARAQRFDRASAAMRRLLDARPPTEDDRLMMARLAMATGRTNEALGELRRVSDSHPAAAQVRLWEGQLELRRRRARAAELSLLRALTIDPSLVEARRDLVYLYGVQRRCDEFSAQLAALAEVAPISLDQMLLWCLIRSAPWHPQEVRHILAAFVQADPGDRASRLALAEAYGALGQHEDVEAVLTHLPATDRDARAILARIAHDHGDHAAVEALLALGPDDHPTLQFFRGRLALLRRDLAAAVRHFRKATAGYPHDPVKLFILGDALVKAGEPAEGQSYLRAASEHENLLKLLERASTEAGRQDLNLLKALGDGYQRVGLIPEARAWYKLALAGDPIDSGVQAALYHLGLATRRPDHQQPRPPVQAPLGIGNGPAVRRTSECNTEPSALNHPVD